MWQCLGFVLNLNITSYHSYNKLQTTYIIETNTTCLCGSVAKASDTQAVGHGFDPRPDH